MPHDIDKLIEDMPHLFAIIKNWDEYIVEWKFINNQVCAIQPFMFTWGVLVNVEMQMYEKRYCFDSLCEASGFLACWDGITEPVVGENGCTAIK